jgi:hypothetical protein
VAIGAKIPQTIKSQFRQASIGESHATIGGAIASIRGFHLDRLPNIRFSENKQLQLQVAREIGLDTIPVADVDLEDLDGLRFCPMTFQEN